MVQWSITSPPSPFPSFEVYATTAGFSRAQSRDWDHHWVPFCCARRERLCSRRSFCPPLVCNVLTVKWRLAGVSTWEETSGWSPLNCILLVSMVGYDKQRWIFKRKTRSWNIRTLEIYIITTYTSKDAGNLPLLFMIMKLLCVYNQRIIRKYQWKKIHK